MTDVRVERLRLSPIKGLRQKEVDTVELVENGIAGDRRFVLVGANGRVRYGAELDRLANVSAEWDGTLGTLSLSGPDGPIVDARVELGDTVEVRSTSGARAVTGQPVRGPFSGLLSELAGERLELLHVGPGAGAPGQITVMRDGSVRRVAEAVGVSAVDPVRFRMSIELAGLEPHREDDWQGRRARVGTATVQIGGQVPRCVLVARDPTTRARDLDLLRAILSYRTPMETGEAPLGVYASVVEPGRIAVGDTVALAR